MIEMTTTLFVFLILFIAAAACLFALNNNNSINTYSNANNEAYNILKTGYANGIISEKELNATTRVTKGNDKR